MVATASTMLPLGTQAPDFDLIDTRNQERVRLSLLPKAPGTVVAFICNHCPFVQHIFPTLIETARLYQERGIRFLAINANDPIAYPDDAPSAMTQLHREKNLPFPYLFDETQNVARAYQAACTPDFFVFDSTLALVYRGQFDSSRPNHEVPCDGASLREALDRLLAGAPLWRINTQPRVQH